MPRPFIWSYSKVRVSTKIRLQRQSLEKNQWRIDRRTNIPKSVGPDLWGLGLININTVSANSIISQISTNIALSPYTMVAWKALPSIVKYSSRVHRAFYHLPSKKKMIYKFLAMRGGVMSQTFHLLIYYCDDFRYWSFTSNGLSNIPFLPPSPWDGANPSVPYKTPNSTHLPPSKARASVTK